jgi:hypothetical protein
MTVKMAGALLVHSQVEDYEHGVQALACFTLVTSKLKLELHASIPL